METLIRRRVLSPLCLPISHKKDTRLIWVNHFENRSGSVVYYYLYREVKRLKKIFKFTSPLTLARKFHDVAEGGNIKYKNIFSTDTHKFMFITYAIRRKVWQDRDLWRIARAHTCTNGRRLWCILVESFLCILRVESTMVQSVHVTYGNWGLMPLCPLNCFQVMYVSRNNLEAIRP